jgi:hypothetical protein
MMAVQSGSMMPKPEDDAQRCFAYGSGLFETTSLAETKFQVIVNMEDGTCSREDNESSARRLDAKLLPFCQNGTIDEFSRARRTSVKITRVLSTRVDSHAFECTYVAPSAGSYHLQVTYNGYDIVGSPWTIAVHPPANGQTPGVCNSSKALNQRSKSGGRIIQAQKQIGLEDERNGIILQAFSGVQKLWKTHADGLEKLFQHYAKLLNDSEESKVLEEDFFTMLADYGICPNFLTREAARACASKREMDRFDFRSALCCVAAFALSAYPFHKLYPTAHQKLEVVLVTWRLADVEAIPSPKLL